MIIKEIFNPTGVTQSIRGMAKFLDKNNCKIVNKTRNENAILLHLKREFDGEEGQAYLRVQNKFKSLEKRLLDWVFANEKIVGLTLNELENLETDLNI